MVESMSDNSAIANEVSKQLPSDLKVYTWQELMKSMVELMKVDSFFGYISIALFFLVIFFVIMIYGFINVSARIREFGVLKSIGLSDLSIDQTPFL